ncbi:hypothetical protein AAG906_000256 [Vitis piasezkii]
MAAVGEHSDLVHQNSAGKSYGCGISGLALIKAAVYLSMDSSGCFRDLGYSQAYQVSLVLESSDSLRMTGFSFTAWTNPSATPFSPLFSLSFFATFSHFSSPYMSNHDLSILFKCSDPKSGKHEVHNVHRRELWWQNGGLPGAIFAGRTSMRGVKYFSSSHGFELKVLHLFGKGIRAGFIPYDDKNKEMEGDPAKVKQFVLDNLGKVPDELREIVESTVLETIISARLRYRKPWELQWGSISKDNVCVVGDALHPMTPDLAQGRQGNARQLRKKNGRKWRGSKWGCRSMPERGDDDALILLRLLIW